MFTLDPAAVTPEMGRKVRVHAPDVLDLTPLSVIARDLGKPSRTYWLVVPSDHRPGNRYDVRVTIRPGYWEAGHYGVACQAGTAGKHCWHLYAAALWVARNVRDPDTGLPVRPDRRIPAPTVTRLRPRPAAPARERPRKVDDAWYG
jgi:hypothetical protein